MPSWLKTLLTDDADQYDVGFCVWLLGALVFMTLACVNYAKFDAQQYGIGLGAVLGGGGAMSWLRSR